MAKKITYYSGATPLTQIQPMKNAEFKAIGGVESKHNWYDSFARLVGNPANSRELMPVTRRIEYGAFPSLHKCNGRCRSAKGHICECECGGVNHGADA